MNLMYNGQGPMNREPVNLPFSALVHQFQSGQTRVAAYVHLEPGDATRYDFVLTRLTRGSWDLTRYVGMDALPLVSLSSYEASVDELERELAELHWNPWTARLLAWWLCEFFEAMGD